MCYAYPDDVDDSAVPRDGAWAFALVRSEWFTRGWTLQELIAPRHVQFYTRDRHLIGSRVTPRSCSDHRYPHTDLSLTLWIVVTTPQYCPNYAMGRQSCRHHACRRPGLSSDRFVGVFMPVLYGEGRHALRRLQLEIMRTSSDQSIFA